jgi:pimeloyl-ACP methyl ester carboxylesterase
MRASILSLVLGLLLASSSFAGEPLPTGIRTIDAKGALEAPSEAATCPSPGQPLAIVVHGINPIHADLDALSRDLVQRDYRVLRFVYDDGAALAKSSRALRRALATLQRVSRPSRLAVVAHSMGGLVSRRALSADELTPPQPTKLRRSYHGGRWRTRRVPRGPAPTPLPALRGPISFLTVASPFGGFRSANWARLDFGLGRAVYRDLGTRARFIRKPGQLAEGVTHVKVETDEEGHSRHDGESDDSVPLKSQTQETVDAAASEVLRLDLGHVGSIRDLDQEVPAELQTILTRVFGGRKAPRQANAGLVKPLQGLPLR